MNNAEDVIKQIMEQRNAVAADGGKWTSSGHFLGEVVVLDLDDLDSLLVYIDQLKEWNNNQARIIQDFDEMFYGLDSDPLT